MSTIMKYRDDDDGWKQAKKSDEVTVWGKSSPHWNGMLYRAESVLPADPETVFRYIDPLPGSVREKWDKAIKELQIVERMGDDLKLLRTITHSAFGGIISSRDFTDLSLTVKTDEFIATMSQGVDHPDCPSSSDYVRGINYPCALICFKIPDNPNQTRLITYNQSDLGGMLPKAIVETALPSNMMNFFTCVKTAMKEDGVMKDD